MHCLSSLLFGLLLLVQMGHSQRRLPRPIGIRVPNRNSRNVTIAWNKPRGANYVRYRITVNPRSAIVVPQRRSMQPWRMIRNLQPGKRYVVTIIGITSNGRRSQPNIYELFSEPLPPTDLQLEAVSGVELSLSLSSLEAHYSVTTSGIRIDWSPSPSTMNGMSGYDVQITPKGGVKMFLQPRKYPGDNSRFFSGLIPGEEYAVSVRTHVGPPYNLVYSSPITDSIRIPPKQPYAASETSVSSTRATIQTIGPLIGIFNSLELILEPDHGHISTPIPYPGRETHDLFTLTGLIPNTEYTLSVYSVSGGVRSRWPEIVTFTTASMPPVKLQVTSFDSESVTLQFDQPEHIEAEGPIEYIIQYEDVLGLSAEGIRSVTVEVQPGNTTVHIKIQELEPGVTYMFKVFTQTGEDEASEVLAETTQTTVPPEPELEFLDGTENGIVAKVLNPYFGRCPNVIVSYSPPLPNETFVEPRIVKSTENFSFPGLPRGERYTIHIRCVSNNVEGPSFDVSSTKQIVPSSFGVPRQQPGIPRTPLLCAHERNSHRPVSQEHVARDACCGNTAYSTTTHSCCGFKPIPHGVLCCVGQDYVREESKCCDGGIVIPRSQTCDSTTA